MLESELGNIVCVSLCTACTRRGDAKAACLELESLDDGCPGCARLCGGGLGLGGAEAETLLQGGEMAANRLGRHAGEGASLDQRQQAT